MLPYLNVVGKFRHFFPVSVLSTWNHISVTYITFKMSEWLCANQTLTKKNIKLTAKKTYWGGSTYMVSQKKFMSDNVKEIFVEFKFVLADANQWQSRRLDSQKASQINNEPNILVQQSTTVSFAGLPLLRTLHKPMYMHKSINSRNW